MWVWLISFDKNYIWINGNIILGRHVDRGFQFPPKAFVCYLHSLSYSVI